MMRLAAFGVRKPVVANLVMLAIIGGGLVFGLGLRREFFPETRPTQVLVTAPYPGASPEEVEQSLAVKIEDRVVELDGVKEINTSIGEGFATVRIEFEDGVDITEALFDVKREMDALQDLPEESERITVDTFEPNLPTINVSLFGDADERVMKDAIRSIRDDLRTIPGMGDITLSGVRNDEISVEVRPRALLEHRLSLTGVTDAIRGEMIELPGGSVRAATANVAVRTMGAEERAAAVRSIVVKAEGDGQALTVGDVADVRQGFEDVDVVSRLNGKPAASLTVYKVGDDDAVEMAALVKAYVAGRNGEPITPTASERLARLAQRPGDTSPVSNRLRSYELGASRPDTLPGTLTTTTDLARFIVGRLDLLSRNAFWGGVLVLLTLVLLLNLRVAFWVAIGLVVSLLGTLVVMHFAGISLNLLTMFGLIIVLGLLVDDAIVVAENITARHERGEPALDAAVRGTAQVGWPVVATVLTTICAFFPLALIGGTIGDLLEVLPLVVACALGVSLIECLFILPSHMGHSLLAVDRARQSDRPSLFDRVEARFDRWREAFFARFVIPGYLGLLRRALRARYLTVTIAFSLLIASFGMVAGGRVEFTFIPDDDSETVNVTLRMPVGTPVEATDPIVRRIEQAALAQPEVTAVFGSIGSVGELDGASSSSGPHLAQLILELAPIEERERASTDVIISIREAVGEIPGVESLRMEGVSGGPGGPAISLGVVGEDLGAMRRVAERLKDELALYDGVFDIADDNDAGRRELRLSLLDGARELGFTTESIARQVRGAVFGLEAHTFAGDQEDVDVRVKYPGDSRRSLAAIESTYVFTPDGRPVPLLEVVEVEETTGYASLRRLDRSRIIEVSAEIDSAVGNPEQVAADLRPVLATLVAEEPGIRIIERGRQKDVSDSFATLPVGMAAAAGMIYVILAWLFSSYIQPLIVMLAIPFAAIGMIWGHFVMGYDLMILSLIGFIALSGVVVNDSLIFMEFYNERRIEGSSVFDALVGAGRGRIRAILLTTVTTVLGLLPLMLEQSFQARFLIPMAITIAAGLMSATLIILVVLPCLLMISHDVRGAVAWAWHAGSPPSRGVAPAERGA